ncbi:peptide chain release factor N(5)-glutamine methyltransferase [Bradyrhizobium sp. LHD-71]|uniref:peptide chain release factor N(5)-glutamine methyltransferase n=1 Tax=Bradyrhizobium sp. LHD-71 TaxID=3072141 RepID=UPI00280D17A5|nr:peptide chain release factor N(5)-glutamine methyltransferase [Bradyrhizobium sp. LHD-71]MDQ8732054.1 peptide chain release factor N(5)-glutamine methyltransferase [Bradyrhizobium sp. LHD-71]
MSDDHLAGLSIEAARRELTRRFKAADLDSPDLDARMLVGAVTRLDLTGMTVAAQRLLTNDERRALSTFAERHLKYEPIARILGEKEFWGLRLSLSADTLVPRADTETVVEAALELVRSAGEPIEPLRIADIGTGSGAILLALLHELPSAIGIGTDISPGALRTATANAEQLGIGARATFIESDYCEKLAGPFDLIVSNPPYIVRADIATLAREVRDYDPRRALDGGSDGLVAYRAMARDIASLLEPGGAFALEVGKGQADEVAELMQLSGLHTIRPHRPDLAGIPRVVWGRKPVS